MLMAEHLVLALGRHSTTPGSWLSSSRSSSFKFRFSRWSSSKTIAVAGWAQNPPYFADSSSNSLRSVDAFLEIVTGTITDPPALLNDAPGGQVTTPGGSQTFAGVTDVLFLRLQR
jgi:hypothetical protein